MKDAIRRLSGPQFRGEHVYLHQVPVIHGSWQGCKTSATLVGVGYGGEPADAAMIAEGEAFMKRLHVHQVRHAVS